MKQMQTEIDTLNCSIHTAAAAVPSSKRLMIITGAIRAELTVNARELLSSKQVAMIPTFDWVHFLVSFSMSESIKTHYLFQKFELNKNKIKTAYDLQNFYKIKFILII